MVDQTSSSILDELQRSDGEGREASKKEAAAVQMGPVTGLRARLSRWRRHITLVIIWKNPYWSVNELRPNSQ